MIWNLSEIYTCQKSFLQTYLRMKHFYKHIWVQQQLSVNDERLLAYMCIPQRLINCFSLVHLSCVNWISKAPTREPRRVKEKGIFPSLHASCCCLVTKSYTTLCNPMDYGVPGFPVLHYLPEFTQDLVHLVLLILYVLLYFLLEIFYFLIIDIINIDNMFPLSPFYHQILVV